MTVKEQRKSMQKALSDRAQVRAAVILSTIVGSVIVLIWATILLPMQIRRSGSHDPVVSELLKEEFSETDFKIQEIPFDDALQKFEQLNSESIRGAVNMSLQTSPVATPSISPEESPVDPISTTSKYLEESTEQDQLPVHLPEGATSIIIP
jgi:cell division septation protein DedD